MIIWEYLSLSVMRVKMKGQIGWSILPNGESTEEQSQPIPYTPYPYTPPIYKLDDLLNDYGAEGWELIGIATHGYSGWKYEMQLQLIFKRPKQEE
jgi:hypothetical protein